MKAGIAIDKWKLTIFESHLLRNGFSYTVGNGVTPDTLTLYVVTNDFMGLKRTVQAANDEAAIMKN